MTSTTSDRVRCSMCLQRKPCTWRDASPRGFYCATSFAILAALDNEPA